MTINLAPIAQALRLLKLELSRTDSSGGAFNAPTTSAPREIAEKQANRPAPTLTPLGSLPLKLRAARSRDGRLSPQKSLRMFIEAALLTEMGEALQLDPAFGDLVERTSQSLENDKDCVRLIDEALTELDALAQ